MILVTGGTGFIGKALVRHLVEMGYRVRLLIRPSRRSPRLPLSVPVEVVICALTDERGLRAAMRGVEAVFHLASAEKEGSRADFQGVDIDGSQVVARAAADAHVQRLLYLSHLGADRASAFPLLKAKGIAERLLLQSGVPCTIFRSAIVFGEEDRFTTALAQLLRISPGIFFLPGDGTTFLQPIWVEDLVTALILALEDPRCAGQTYSLGGPEYLTFRQVTELVAQAAGVRRWLVPLSPASLRLLAIWADHLNPSFPMGTLWLDYLAADRTCDLDTLPRVFGLMPERFAHQLNHLRPQGSILSIARD